MIEVKLEFGPGQASVGKARRVLERFSGSVPKAKLDDARLVVSELVTNGIKHAALPAEGGGISLRVVARRGVIEGEVCDAGGGFEPPGRPSPREDLTGGWGLYIVDRLCDRWGIRRGGLFCVWFEIRWENAREEREPPARADRTCS